jgi:hypothetical protein
MLKSTKGHLLDLKSELIQDIKPEDQLSEAKMQHGNHLKMSLPVSWEIKRQKTTVTWWLIL